jgi:hypothetical protein
MQKDAPGPYVLLRPGLRGAGRSIPIAPAALRPWGSREGADWRRAGEPRLASAVTIPFISSPWLSRTGPSSCLGGGPIHAPRAARHAIAPAWSPKLRGSATVVVLGVGTCESAVCSPGAGRLLWMAPITAAGPSPAPPATVRPRWACSLVGVVGGVGVRVCIGDGADDDRRHCACRSCYCCNCAIIVLGISLKRHDAQIAAFDVVRRHFWPLRWPYTVSDRDNPRYNHLPRW